MDVLRRTVDVSLLRIRHRGDGYTPPELLGRQFVICLFNTHSSVLRLHRSNQRSIAFVPEKRNAVWAEVSKRSVAGLANFAS
jgi:hypothetical protein